MERRSSLNLSEITTFSSLVVGLSLLNVNLALAGTTTLLRPIQSVLDMILGLITVVATLALILGVLDS